MPASGHSQPRTHRGHDAKFPGMAITYALMQRLEELVESDPERVQIIKKARVSKINKEGNKVTGVTYEFGGEESSIDGVVVLATGGYAADFSDTSLLKKHRPDTYDLASTNGTHATGDGLKMLMAIGGNGIDLDKVQVHPTGLVDPKDPDSKWKFLAAEGMSRSISITVSMWLILPSSSWRGRPSPQRRRPAFRRRTRPPRLRFRRDVEGKGSQEVAHSPRPELQSLQRPRLPHPPLLGPRPDEENVRQTTRQRHRLLRIDSPKDLHNLQRHCRRQAEGPLWQEILPQPPLRH